MAKQWTIIGKIDILIYNNNYVMLGANVWAKVLRGLNGGLQYELCHSLNKIHYCLIIK